MPQSLSYFYKINNISSNTFRAYLLIVLIGTSFITLGQTSIKEDPQWDWIRKIDGENTQVIQDFCLAPNGDIIIAGQCENRSGADFHSNRGIQKLRLSDSLTSYNSCSFLARYSKTGKLLWVTPFTSKDEIYSRDLALDNEGNILITGQFKYKVEFHSTGRGKRIELKGRHDPKSSSGSIYPDKPSALYVAKYSAGGKALWAKAGISKSHSCGFEINTDKNNNVYVRGYSTYDPLYFGDISYMPLRNTKEKIYVGNCNIVLIKCTPSGKEDWVIYGTGSANFGSGSGSGHHSMTINEQGNVSIKTLCLGATHLISSNGWLKNIHDSAHTQIDVEISSEGNFISNQPSVNFEYKGEVKSNSGVVQPDPSFLSFRNRINRIVRDHSGNYYVMIQSWCNPGIVCEVTFGSKTIQTQRYDILLAKYNAEKEFVWINYIGGDNREIPRDMVVDQNNNVIISGWYQGDMYVLDSKDQKEKLKSERGGAFIISFDSLGEFNWATNAGLMFRHDYDLPAVRLGVDSENHLVIAGVNNMPTKLGKYPISLAGKRKELHWAWAKDKGYEVGATDAFFARASLGPQTLDQQQDTANQDSTIKIDFAMFDSSMISSPDSLNVQQDIFDVSVFPNPANLFVNVSLNIGNAVDDVTFKLINSAGKIVFETVQKQAAGYISQKISFESLPSGVYYVVIETLNQKVTRKVVAY